MLSPTFRAVARSASDSTRLTFAYQGATDETRALGSGAIRQQIGLKLRAQDPCNLLYVMWRITPVNEVVVSVKRNPGRSTSAECGNHGYTNLEPAQRSAPPTMTVGSDHVLAAHVDGSGLEVRIDGAVVWRGDIGAEAFRLRGPVGVRGDNVRARCRFSLQGTEDAAVDCRAGESQD